jgi:hypothetical protein
MTWACGQGGGDGCVREWFEAEWLEGKGAELGQAVAVQGKQTTTQHTTDNGRGDVCGGGSQGWREREQSKRGRRMRDVPGSNVGWA